jgi:predicted enzyme related to lactoylglutathione lyase
MKSQYYFVGKILKQRINMSIKEKPEIGSITWFDLTFPDAGKVSAFYSKVVGWKTAPVSMGNYNDYNMSSPESGKTNAGICHKRGGNAQLPAHWLIYITVKSTDESAKLCTENGGKVLVEPKDMSGYGRYCVIEDPAGAVCALFEPA